MKSYNLLYLYVWLLDTIKQNGPISLEEINNRWVRTEMSGGVELSRYTFIRYKNALAETFGIDIECNRRTNRYFISNRQVLHDNTIQRWMLSTLTVSNIVSESLSLQDHILLENIPCEGKTLSLILDAIKQQRCISFLYKKHIDAVAKQRLVSPCCIKLFHQRWYVIDYNIRNKPLPYKVFAFDRISQLSITDQEFELPKGFRAESIFTDSFGIFISDTEKPIRVVIRAFGDESKYIRDLPLHHTQEVLKEGENYTDYKFYIRPSHDFIAELLSKGNRIEVLSPESVRERVCEEHLQAANLYKKLKFVQKS